MKMNILLVIILAVLAITSACGTEPIPPTLVPLTDINQPEINTISTVEVINTAISNDGSAHSALLQFFDQLHIGRYEEAVNLYEGSYQVMVDQNPAIDPADHVELMKSACTINGFQCLQIKIAGIEYKPSPNEYLFTVQFQNDDGSLFEMGPCCGASETEQSPVSLFEIRVIQVAEGQFHVLDMPPYMP
jgi:hypothetical protein